MINQSRVTIKPFRAFALIYGFVAVLFSTPVAAQYSFPNKPDNQNFYVDTASMLSAEDATALDEIARALLRDEQVALIVVTVPSLLTYGASGDRIESYAQALFNSWGLGRQDKNYGMLLLVSRGDRKARIELGADWDASYNTEAEQVMQQLIIPEFRNESYSAGILSGVRGLDAMARGLALPKRPTPWWAPVVLIGGLVVIIGVIISLFKSGRSGWGWALIVALGALIAYSLYAASRSGGSSGAFGGGSSGGGGATGSW